MTSPANQCPSLHSALLIGDHPRLIAEASTVLASKKHYLPIIDAPRLQRPDSEDEVARRYNVAARTQPKAIFLAGLSDEAAARLAFPNRRTYRFDNAQELYVLKHGVPLREQNYYEWGSENLAIGCLLAMRSKKILKIIDRPQLDIYVPSESGHLVICETHNNLSTIIAANYAYSLGAGLLLIPTPSELEATNILEGLYGLNDTKEYVIDSPTQRLEQIKERLRNLAGDLPIARVDSVTFVTSSLPWGFAFSEKPSTHLFTYPDFGINLANAISAEQPHTPGVRVATIIEPGVVNAREVDVVVDTLARRSVLIREFKDERASVRSISNMIEVYPYDLLFISSHCGDDSGWRFTYEFRDSSGLARVLVVDVAASFALKPGTEMVSVHTHERFVSIDGVPWNDPDRDSRVIAGTALIDWAALTKEPGGLKPISREIIGRVPGSAAIKLHNGTLLVAPTCLASHNVPIVINNACTSWHNLAQRFLFGNARAYLGTLVEVLDTEASSVIESIFTRHYGKPLALALWHAQNSIFGNSVRRPYVFTGPHFQTLRSVPGDKVRYLKSTLANIIEGYKRSLLIGISLSSFQKSKIEDFIGYLTYEIGALGNAIGDLRDRPKSSKEELYDK